MSYLQTTFIGTNCPKCQRKLTIILNEQQPADSLAVCFRCKQVIDLNWRSLSPPSQIKVSTKVPAVSCAYKKIKAISAIG